ncbi:MAG: squalene/phytoene synthase family protein [Elusimicrobiaceae bacterium]|nr:squalene/phytoene synthase family protein [Elusimicrobiaceae bacterium]
MQTGKNQPGVNRSYQKSSFGPAFFFLSKRRRDALAAYYEFCRLMDDIADEPNVENPLAALAFWQEEIERVFKQSAQTALGKQLTSVVQEFALTPDRFLLLIEGMRADLEGKTYHTLDELTWYLHRVAVVVGLATLDILEVRGPQAQSLAQALGHAVQLTNIIRDVPEDAQLGRVYLPEDLLARYGLSRMDVLAGREQEKQAKLLRRLAQLAYRNYIQAFENMKQFERSKMLPCRIMGCVYAENLAKIKKTGFLFSKPVKLTKLEKIKGALHALFKTVFP